MPDGTAVKGSLPPILYRYDGSFEGLLCCVYDSYTARQPATDIQPMREAQSTLYPAREVETNEANAARVYVSLEKKLGAQGRDLVTTAFLYGGEEKAFDLYRFIVMGYRVGPSVAYMLGDELVSRVHKMSRAVRHEAHLLTGFIRFSQYSTGELSMLPQSGEAPRALQKLSGKGASRYIPSGALAAVIDPKHRVLPLISRHFCSRYPEEHFLIFDKTHRQALVYQPHSASLLELDSLELPPAEEEEALCRRLWKGYYDAISIKARENPKCRMSHMPKRFWGNLTEME